MSAESGPTGPTRPGTPDRPVGPVGPIDPIDPGETGGDAACWLDRLCPECGAMPEGAGAEDPSVPCWRCGAVRAQAPGDDARGPGAG